jgi:hypothetical protein
MLKPKSDGSLELAELGQCRGEATNRYARQSLTESRP